MATRRSFFETKGRGAAHVFLDQGWAVEWQIRPAHALEAVTQLATDARGRLVVLLLPSWAEPSRQHIPRLER